MKSRAIGFGFFVLALCGCTVPQLTQSMPFDEAAFQWSVGSGTAQISGSAFLKTRAGEVKVGAGNTVELIPETPYTAERFQLVLGNPYGNMPPRDSRLEKYIRRTIADAQGNFEFRDLPAGRYIAVCTIEWRIQIGSTTGITGGQGVGFVNAAAGEISRVVVTR